MQQTRTPLRSLPPVLGRLASPQGLSGRGHPSVLTMRRSAAIEFGMEVVAWAAETARDADFAVDAIFSGNRMRAVDRLNRITARSERIAAEARDWTAAAEAAR